MDKAGVRKVRDRRQARQGCIHAGMSFFLFFFFHSYYNNYLQIDEITQNHLASRTTSPKPPSSTQRWRNAYRAPGMFFIYFLLDDTNVFRVYVRYCLLWRGRLGQGLETLINWCGFFAVARQQKNYIRYLEFPSRTVTTSKLRMPGGIKKIKSIMGPGRRATIFGDIRILPSF